MNIASQLAKHIEFLGFGIFDKSIFWGWMPDFPDTAVCVYSTNAGTPGSDTGARLQIVTRAPSVKAAFELSQGIAESIDCFTGYLFGEGSNANIDIINASSGIGEDSARRALFSTNITIKYCDGE